MPVSSARSPIDPAEQARLNRAVVAAFDALPARKQAFSPEDLADLRAALDAGGSPNQTESNGYNLLGIAVYRACQQKRKSTTNWPVPPLVALLLEFKASPNAAIHRDSSEAALREAAYSPSLHLVDALLAAGADPAGRAAPAARSPHRQDLYRAALHNPFSAEHARRLIDAGADLNVTDDNGCTPLHTAILFGKDEVVDVLLERGADPNASSVDGSTPLHQVTAPTQVDRLLAAGADPSRRNHNGHTPLDTLRQTLADTTARLATTPTALRDKINGDVQRLATIVVQLDRAELQQGLNDHAPSPAVAEPRARL